jgi:hypothetical protein
MVPPISKYKMLGRVSMFLHATCNTSGLVLLPTPQVITSGVLNKSHMIRLRRVYQSMEKIPMTWHFVNTPPMFNVFCYTPHIFPQYRHGVTVWTHH